MWMKSKNCIVIFSLAISLLLAFISFTIMSFVNVNQYVGLYFGIAVMCLSGIFSLLLKKVFYPFAIALNGLATGLTISSLFVHLGAYPPIWQTAAVAVATGLLFLLFILICKISAGHKFSLFLSILYFVIILVAEILCAIFVEKLAFYYALFMLLPFIGHAFLIIADLNYEKMFKYLMLVSFSFLIIAIIVVLIVLTEGDALDGFDLIPDGGKKNKKIKK